MTQEPDKDRRSLLSAYATYSAAAIELVLLITGGAIGGQWLDNRLGTDPWFMIAGVIVGTASGFALLFRILARDREPNDTDANPK